MLLYRLYLLFAQKYVPKPVTNSNVINRTKSKAIPLAKPYFGDEEISEIQKVLESGWVAQGPKVKEFENAICKSRLKI